MKIEVKERNEETGEIECAGWLNKTEVSFLLQYAINQLMAMGAVFDIKREQEENNKDELRIKLPTNETIQ